MHVSGALFASFLLRPILVDQILEAQLEDPYLMSIRRKVEEGEQSDFAIRNDGALVIGSRLCVPAAEELKGQILGEAHSSAYAMHPGSTKMYRTLKEYYWWAGMKREVVEYVSKCLVCQQVKRDKNLLDFCNPYPFQNGNGNTSQWILYSSSLPQLRDMTTFG